MRKNTAVIGAGWFGKAHCRVYDTISNLRAICDINEKQAQDVAKQYSISYYTNPLDMIKNEDLDSVSVVTPPAQIPKIAEQFAQKGINVLLEKPLGTSVKAVEKLLEYQNDVRLTPGFIELFNPVFKTLEENIHKIGQPVCVSSRRIGRYPKRSWGIGVLLDLGFHEFYIHRKLFGDVNHIESLLSYFHNDEYEDSALVLLKFKSGVNGLIEANWMTPTRYRKIITYGHKGAIEIDYVSKRYTLIKSSADENGRILETIEPYSVREPLLNELDAFLNDKENPITLTDGLKTLKLTLEAAKKSH